MDQVKVAVIGCGYFGNFRLQQLMRIKDVTVTAVVSSSLEKLQRIRDILPGIHGYSSSEELFQKEKKLDAIIVCVPPACHGAVEVQAAQRGIHIFTEKPVGLSLEKARKIEQTIHRSHVISSVGYQGRYNPHLEKLRQHLQMEKAGIITGRFICGCPQSDWWSDSNISGGQLVEQVTHVFDMLRYLFGEVKEVYGLKGEKDGVDCSTVSLAFDGGEIATIVSGSYLDSQVAQASVGLTIFTNQTQIEYDWDRYLQFTNSNGTNTWNFVEDKHLLCLKAFIQAIKEQDPSLIRSDYSDGVRSLRLTLAAQYSLEVKKPIIMKNFI